MSSSAYINISLVESITPSYFIKKLLENGWSMNDYGSILYLPLDDHDYDWEYEDLSKANEVLSVIKQKELKKQNIGISMTWKDTNIGFQMLISHEYNNILFSLTIGKNLIKDTKLIDFSWYLEKIINSILVISKIDIIESVECKYVL